MFSRISKLFMVCIMLTVIGGVQQVTAVEMEAGTWTQKADMPTGRFHSGAAVVNGKIYVIGGGPIGKWLSTTVEEYDPAADTWTIRPDMPTERIHCLGAAAVDGIIYVIGGWVAAAPPGLSDSRTVLAYDPAVDKWTKKTDMPTGRCRLTTSVVDGKIYAIGGKNISAGMSTVEAYDPATDKWTKKANMQTGRMEHAACVIDGRIYVSGGTPLWPIGPPTLSYVEVYDPATDTWTRVSDMPLPRHGHTASAVDGRMYIIGGQDEETIRLLNEGKLTFDEVVEIFSSVDVYDPATDTWTTAANFPFPRSYLTASVVNGKIYAVGGGRGVPDDVFARVDEFDPSLPDSITGVSPAGKLETTWGEVKSE